MCCCHQMAPVVDSVGKISAGALQGKAFQPIQRQNSVYKRGFYTPRACSVPPGSTSPAISWEGMLRMCRPWQELFPVLHQAEQDEEQCLSYSFADLEFTRSFSCSEVQPWWIMSSAPCWCNEKGKLEIKNGEEERGEGKKEGREEGEGRKGRKKKKQWRKKLSGYRCGSSKQNEVLSASLLSLNMTETLPFLSGALWNGKELPAKAVWSPELCLCFGACLFWGNVEQVRQRQWQKSWKF